MRGAFVGCRVHLSDAGWIRIIPVSTRLLKQQYSLVKIYLDDLVKLDTYNTYLSIQLLSLYITFFLLYIPV